VKKYQPVDSLREVHGRKSIFRQLPSVAPPLSEFKCIGNSNAISPMTAVAAVPPGVTASRGQCPRAANAHRPRIASSEVPPFEFIRAGVAARANEPMRPSRLVAEKFFPQSSVSFNDRATTQSLLSLVICPSPYSSKLLNEALNEKWKRRNDVARDLMNNKSPGIRVDYNSISHRQNAFIL
jgi:hypothetical protein